METTRSGKKTNEKILVLCIDRDNDLGRKTKISGPVMGKENCLKAAVALAIADPADTDANTMFDAVKTFENSGAAGVAVVTGDIKVGVESDRTISRQLDSLGSWDGVILVTDGAEDEYVMPLVQSRMKIVSLRRVVVKQAEQLESAYYTALDFFKRIMKDRELSRMLLGIPGTALLLFYLFGMSAWRFIIGIFGLYLVIKGMQLESSLDSFLTDFRASFREMRFSFFTYVLAIVLFLVALFQGINAASDGASVVIAAASFVHDSAFTFLLSGVLVSVGKGVDAYPDLSRILYYISSTVLMGVSAWVLKAASTYFIEPAVGLTNLVSSVLIGLILVVATGLLRKAAMRLY